MSMSPLPAGMVLREPRGSLKKRIAGAGIGVLVGVLLALAFFGLWWTIVLGVLALVVVSVLAKDSLQATLRWHRPTLQVSSSPYALGAAPTVVYRRKPKRVVDISACTVECLLVCEEEVTYTQGTDTVTESRRVYENQTVGNGEGTADGLVAEIELNISAKSGAPSFKLENNQVQWYAQIEVSGARLPRDSHTFEIDVAAVLDARYRVRLQDT